MRILYLKQSMFLIAVFGAAILWANSYFFDQPRVLAVREVPVSFWFWRSQVPTTADLQDAVDQANARTLFLRAGQFDLVNGSVERTKPVAGTLSSPIATHLVYNGTRRFLSDWEKAEISTIAEQINGTYQTDLVRANRDQVEIAGLQLDLDIPTRLLPRYAQLLRDLRELLPRTSKLSITGLPTWATADDIKLVLAEVDFWIPQCYGSKIPTRLDERIPISSALDIERTMSRVRRLNKPFFAGLSAYSQSILYGKDGELLELRGDIDLFEASQNSGLELIERENFLDSAASEIRYVFRSKGDVILTGLVIRAGETLVFIVPTAASLRAGANAVRENAGEMLLGICIFRLPTGEDKTTLSLGEIAAAVNDTEPTAATTLTLETGTDGQFNLRAENTGSASAVLRTDALTIDLAIPPGEVGRSVGLTGFTQSEPLCGEIETNDLQPCSPMRANVMRLTAGSWKPGSKAEAALSIEKGKASTLAAFVTIYLSDGRVSQESFDLKIPNKRETK